MIPSELASFEVLVSYEDHDAAASNGERGLDLIVEIEFFRDRREKFPEDWLLVWPVVFGVGAMEVDLAELIKEVFRQRAHGWVSQWGLIHVHDTAIAMLRSCLCADCRSCREGLPGLKTLGQ